MSSKSKRFRGRMPIRRPFLKKAEAIQWLKSRARNGFQDAKAIKCITMLEGMGYFVTDYNFPMQWGLLKAPKKTQKAAKAAGGIPNAKGIK